jgi:L-galactose dehydrogenase
MQRVVLGRTGLNVSVMGLGGGGDSRLGVKADTAEATRLVRLALDRGVNFIDTAEAYGTEEVVGRALSEVRRTDVVLSTKKTTFGERPLQPESVVASLEASLKRLRTDYVDVYHLHGVAPEDYADLRERIVPVLLELRRQGKIRFLGITEKFVVDPQHRMLEQALIDDIWDVVMVGFNFLNQSARERVFNRTRARNIGTLIMFAVRRALSQPERLAEILTDLAERGQISPEQALEGLSFLVQPGVAGSIPEAAYRFCHYEPGAHVVLSGTSRESHLLENVTSLGLPELPPATRARLIELFSGVDHLSGQ